MADPEDLKGREEAANAADSGQPAQPSGEEGSLYKPSPAKKSILKGGLKGRLRKYVIISVLPTVLLVTLALFFAIFLPTLKIPQLAAHIEEYRLARLSRVFYKQATLLTTDRAAIDAANNPAAEDALLKRGGQTGAKFATFRPRAVMENMKGTGALSFETNAKGKITTVKIGNHAVTTPKYEFGHPIANYKDRLRFAVQADGAMHDVLRDKNLIVRMRASKLLLGGFGVKLSWYQKLLAKSKYENVSEAEANRLMLEDTTKEITTTAGNKSAITAVDEAADKATQAKDACIADTKCGQEYAKTGELPKPVTDAVDEGAKALNNGPHYYGVPSIFNRFLNVLNPLYAVAMPMCIIYDGSVDFSKTFLNNQNIAATKTFFAVAVAADQQKKGDLHAKALAAFNHQAGKIVDSIPEQLARGETVDTSNEVSPQAGKSGEFTVFNALFGGGTTGSIANGIAKTTCPTITNAGVNLGLTVVNVVVGLASDGTTQAEEAGIKAAVTAFIKGIGESIAKKVTTAEGRAVLKNTARKYAIGIQTNKAAVDGGTYLSRMLILSEMGAFFDGTDSADFANQADAGGAVYGNELNRRMSYGRPLAKEEVKPAQTDALTYNDLLKQQGQSNFEKYFAVSNPDSMSNKLAMKLSAVNFASVKNFFLGFSHTLANLFSPLSPILSHSVGAAAASDNADYGVMQFGWSKTELEYINQHASMDPLENAQIVAQSGQEKAIGSTYGECFTKDTADLLAGGLIDRDDAGNIKNDSAKCSPPSLGLANTQFDAKDCDHCVFRWRWDHSSQNTLDELLGIQNPTEDNNGGGGGGASCDSPGYAPYDPGEWNKIPAGIQAAIESHAPNRKDNGAACGVVPNAHPSDPTKTYMGEWHFIDPFKPERCDGDDLGSRGGNQWPGQMCVGIKYRDPLNGQNTQIIPIGGGNNGGNNGDGGNGGNDGGGTCGPGRAC